MAFTGGTATIPRDKSHSLVDRWFGNVGLFGKVSLWQVPGRAGAGQLCIVPC